MLTEEEEINTKIRTRKKTINSRKICNEKEKVYNLFIILVNVNFYFCSYNDPVFRTILTVYKFSLICSGTVITH